MCYCLLYGRNVVLALLLALLQFLFDLLTCVAVRVAYSQCPCARGRLYVQRETWRGNGIIAPGLNPQPYLIRTYFPPQSLKHKSVPYIYLVRDYTNSNIRHPRWCQHFWTRNWSQYCCCCCCRCRCRRPSSSSSVDAR